MFEPKRVEEREKETQKVFNRYLDECFSITTDDFLNKLMKLENNLHNIDSFLHNRNINTDDLAKTIKLVKRCKEVNLLDRPLSSEKFVHRLISIECSKKSNLNIHTTALTKHILKIMANLTWLETEESEEHIILFCLEDLERKLRDKKYGRDSRTESYENISHKSKSEITVKTFNLFLPEKVELQDFLNRTPEIYNPDAFENLIKEQNKAIGILKRQKVRGEYAVKKWRYDWKDNIKILKDLNFTEKAIKKAEKLNCWLVKKEALLKHI